MQYNRYAYLILGATLSVWLPASSTSAELPPGAADSVDLIQALKLAQSPAVETTTGACSNREGQHAPDTAYRLKHQSVISVPTAVVFPDGFPFDFSILAVFRVSGSGRGELFTVYSADGNLILSVKIARKIIVVYKTDDRGRRSRLRFRVKLKNNTWQRLGISVKGNSATAILDCSQQDTQEVARTKHDLKTDGIILYGQEIDDKTFF